MLFRPIKRVWDAVRGKSQQDYPPAQRSMPGERTPRPNPDPADYQNATTPDVAYKVARLSRRVEKVEMQLERIEGQVDTNSRKLDGLKDDVNNNRVVSVAVLTLTFTVVLMVAGLFIALFIRSDNVDGPPPPPEIVVTVDPEALAPVIEDIVITIAGNQPQNAATPEAPAAPTD